MSITIIGGDKLGKIPNRLKQLGFDCVSHITGRKCKACHLTKETDMVLVLTDYVSHNLCNQVKAQAKDKDLSILFCRRSWARIYKKLNFCGFLN
ncbi:DUF2325 domain-containing protein [Selenihalanaerobacter shriftii]|uniref:Dihydroorotate dehydrogenase n=1 Tax=Selenihalanaerobacter shriftii TaxID=142842 RepID=A0A1T4MWL8_9FIRM|nr:DUF2325 domain-containing protein [Selenihalanaerobacter shriftii]SJZ71175.1 hypothetical protein SAMN02745118_01612 [Selenihalanaerobacter shriftii]